MVLGPPVGTPLTGFCALLPASSACTTFGFETAFGGSRPTGKPDSRLVRRYKGRNYCSQRDIWKLWNKETVKLWLITRALSFPRQNLTNSATNFVHSAAAQMKFRGSPW